MTSIEKFDNTVDTSEWSTPWKGQARELRDLFERVSALTLCGHTFTGEQWTSADTARNVGLLVTMTGQRRDDWVRILFSGDGKPIAVSSRDGVDDKSAQAALDVFCSIHLGELLREVA